VSDHGTAIQWTHVPGYKGETWNPVTGCDRVSPGCAHCYALELASRLKRMGQPRYQRDGDPKTSGPGFGLTLHADRLMDPFNWRKPRAVFVNSMSDLFHEEIPFDYIDHVHEAMVRCPQHIFMVLTKRPERMVEWASRFNGHTNLGPDGKPWPNIWLGVTIENRRFVDRADLLRETPAAVRFISAEPLLGPVVHDRVDATLDLRLLRRYWSDGYEGPELDLMGIDWVITGGESGPKYRSFDPAWASVLGHRCAEAGVAFFHKQNGGSKPTSNGRLLDGRTYDEFPTVAA
jgi:protein gp37